jgi:outer membrane receptor protein involved in Fe transport
MREMEDCVLWVNSVRPVWIALCALFALSVLSPARADDSSATGGVHVVLFGTDSRALPGVQVSAAGFSADTNADGAANLALPPATHTLRLQVPKALVPEAPIAEGPWVIDIPDVLVAEGQTSELILTLSAQGAIAGLDLQTPATGGETRSLERAYQEALASAPPGTVRGLVLASEGRAPVSGASVYVRGVPVDARTDEAGRFELKLPPGSYALSVIHPKFSTQLVANVAVESEQVTEREVELSPASVELEELVVTAPHIEGGIATLIAERRETTAVADVIGAEQMSRSGASNAAAALLRVTGLTIVDGKFVIVRGMGERYSNLLVNRLQVPSPDPTRRVVPLDLFPAGIIDSVIVQKTYSPDMPGEFGGGSVQLRTKTYPDKFTLNVSAATGGNHLSLLRQGLTSEGGRTDFLGIDDGGRALPGAFDDPRGKIVPAGIRGGGYSEEEIGELDRSLSSNYAVQRRRTPPDISLSVSVGDKYRTRFADVGFVAAVGYKSEYSAQRDAVLRTYVVAENPVKDDFRINRYARQVSLSAFLDWGVEFSKLQKLKFTTMLLRQTDDETIRRVGREENLGATSRLTRLDWVERQVLSQQVGGSHTFPALARFQADWRYAFARATRYQPDRRDYLYVADANEQNYAILGGGNGNERLFADGADSSHEGQLDLTQPVGLWKKLTAKVKAGALAYTRTRDSRVRRFQYTVNGVRPADLLQLPPETLFGPNRPDGVAFRESTFANDSYDAQLSILAGYGMIELPIVKQLDIMAGARFEKAVIRVETFDQFSPGTKQEAELDDKDALPAATVTWRFIKDFQLRGGYSRTLNRPDFRELSESRFNDVESNSLIVGNAKLKRARIDNLDARLEWYYTSDEVFSVGAFAKFFDDPIESVQRQSGSELIFSFENSDSAKSYGLEFEGRKRFDFVNKRLDPLFAAANFTLIKSTVSVPLSDGSTYDRPLASQSPYVLNLQLGWDDSAEGGSGVAASLLYNVFGKRLRNVGNPETDYPDVYERPVHSLDFVASQNLPHGWKLGLRLRNLANAQVVWTQGDLEVRRFRRGVDGQLNASWSY